MATPQETELATRASAANEKVRESSSSPSASTYNSEAAALDQAPNQTDASEQANAADADANPSSTDAPMDLEAGNEAKKYDWRFWMVFLGLLSSTLVSALDGSIVSTALPTIVATLDLGPNYIWVANVYFLTGAVFQPLFGQLSDLWGRRWVFLSILAIFTLGSGLCGGAKTGNMLIAARAVQGVGAGGINMMVDLIICDLVPMADRSKFLGLIFLFIGLFTAVGPLVGGALAQAGQWRWTFYLSLPFCGISILVTFLFLNVKTRDTKATFASKMARVDWGGVTILTLSTVGVMYAVTYGGSERAWTAPSVLGPLVAGLVALVLFALYEMSPFVREPVTPKHLFANRTSAAAFGITFLHSAMSLWVMYILAVYFQAVLSVSPTLSGVYLIPTVVAFPLFAAVGGGVMAKFGRYKPIHLVGMALMTVGAGLSSILGVHASPAEWVFFQLFMAVGLGLMIACLLPAVQARLDEADTALSTGTWAFVRSYGVIWGVTIPAAIFNNRFDQLIDMIDDPAARATLGHGQAYGHATAALVDSFQGVTRDQVKEVYCKSLQRVWQIAVVLSGLAFLLALVEREVPLRTELETDFGLEGGEKKPETGPAEEERQA